MKRREEANLEPSLGFEKATKLREKKEANMSSNTRTKRGNEDPTVKKIWEEASRMMTAHDDIVEKMKPKCARMKSIQESWKEKGLKESGKRLCLTYMTRIN